MVDPDISVEDYSKRWLDIVQATVKQATYDSYSNMLRLHVLPAFGSVKLRQLQRGRIREWLAGRLTASYARESVRIMQATLRAMINAAIDDGVIVANPANGLARQLRLTTTAAHRQEEIKAMTREQVLVFLATAEPEVAFEVVVVALISVGGDDVIARRKLDGADFRRRCGFGCPMPGMLPIHRAD